MADKKLTAAEKKAATEAAALAEAESRCGACRGGTVRWRIRRWQRFR